MRLYNMNWFMKLVMPGVKAITLRPFGCYFREEKYKILSYDHEYMHWLQQGELLCVFFYIWYFIEWLIKIPFCGKKAYISICFEQEAYKEVYWLRKDFGFLKYVFKCY